MKHFNETHGHTKIGVDGRQRATPEYYTWSAMKARCHSAGSSGFEKYGAKGVSVCERWRNSFEAFLEDMGPRPSPDHSIERNNHLGNYEPGNCRWATLIEQANNKSTSRFLVFDGRSMTLAQWSRESGVDADVIALRVDRNGWDVGRAIFTKERSAACGLRGVYWQAARKKWSARFTRDKVLHDLGRFDSLLDAAAALLGNSGRAA